jgi:hypothetical protein
MGDFLSRLSRYPQFFITIVLGVFWTLIKPLKGFMKNPVTAVAVIGLVVGGITFLSLTLSAMLGLTTLD